MRLELLPAFNAEERVAEVELLETLKRERELEVGAEPTPTPTPDP
tara:strand:- start:232 stop:366 length:135 start_codon:yes stop_codon:yes gene_type:complete